jgi:hypothetical protein
VNEAGNISLSYQATTCYQSKEGTNQPKLQIPISRPRSSSKKLFAAANGLYSCVDDLLIWGYHLLQNQPQLNPLFSAQGVLPAELDPRNDSSIGLGWVLLQTPTL